MDQITAFSLDGFKQAIQTTLREAKQEIDQKLVFRFESEIKPEFFSVDGVTVPIDSATSDSSNIDSDVSIIQPNQSVGNEVTTTEPLILERETVKSPNSYEQIVQEASQKYGVDAKLINAVIHAESSGNPEAVSKSGAKGLMQIMPMNYNHLGITNPFDPRQNIMGGTRMLADLLKRYDGDIPLTLAGYNAGPGNVKKFGGIPPFPETQNYVKKITAALS